MPTYRITSGNTRTRVVTPYPAEASALAVYALTMLLLEHDCAAPAAAEKGLRLGSLIEVRGGQYRKWHQVYFGTAQLLRNLGRMEGPER
jgi:hypothetical protein